MANRFKIVFMALCIFGLAKTSLAAQEPDKKFLKGYSAGDWQIDFGIEDRVRYEYKNDFDFNESKKDDGSLIFNRLIINSRATLKDKYEIFMEGLDARVGNYQIKKTTQTDKMDLHQAYFRMNNIASYPFDIKLGRQQMKYGKGRLVWASSWANKIACFDAGVLHHKGKGFWIDLFSGR